MKKKGLRLLLISGMALLFYAVTLFFVEQAYAHGYMDSPASRALLCKQGENNNCGAVQYEPQSIEAKKGFPEAGPEDGKIASGGIFLELDE